MPNRMIRPRYIISILIILLIISIKTYISHTSLPAAPTLDTLSSYIASFPIKLRGPDVRGVPDEGDGSNWYVGRRMSGKEEFDWPRMNKMFVFGDSFSNLNTEYRKNGVDGGHPKHLHDKATDMKWTDYLYAVFKDYHTQQYWNFARDGAVIDYAVMPPRIASYGALSDQVKDFEDLFTPIPGPRNVDWRSNDTLFILAFGVNDLRNVARLEYKVEEIKNTTYHLAQSLINQSRKLSALGARHFLYLNIPPLEVAPKYALPSQIGYSVRHIIKFATDQYNEQLRIAIDQYDKQEPEVNAMLFDWNGLWKIMWDYPELFGLTEPGRYQMKLGGRQGQLGRLGFWFHDPGHPSWSVANLLARAVHGMLLRRSSSFWMSDATEDSLLA